VAEGIETQEQLAMLRDMGCEMGQGYLFSQPADASSVEQLLVTQHSAVAQLERMTAAAART
jgi:EAL domain-containing protein (putative c-di-GMP-specific phosphodiesterase class I)